MVNATTMDEVALVTNRRFQGGRVFPLWQMFRKGALTGKFSFTGKEWSTRIDLVQGKVKRLEFIHYGVRVVGMAGFKELRQTLRSDEGTKFSIAVPQTGE